MKRIKSQAVVALAMVVGVSLIPTTALAAERKPAIEPVGVEASEAMLRTDTRTITMEREGRHPQVTDYADVTEDSMRMTAKLDRGAPSSLTYRFDKGTTFEEVGDGSLVLLQDGEVVGQAHIPWAIDANGKELPTYYRVQGHKLVQVIDTKGAAYPIVSDPYITAGWYIYVTFRKTEVPGISNHINTVAYSVGIGYLCAKIPHPIAAAGCLFIGLTLWTSIKNTFQSAKNQNKCVRFRYPYTGLVVPALPSWYVYSC